jgi:hypothetical protein
LFLGQGIVLIQPEKVMVPCGILTMAQKSAIFGKCKSNMQQLRDKALKLCADHGITVQPYAGGWWLVGEKINRVVGELAGLCASDITPLPVMAR